MKKRVAILTQPLTNNYGGILQAYALQQVLREMGHKPITINRHGQEIPSWYRALSKVKHHILRKPTTTHKVTFNKKELETINANSTEFISKHISLSEYVDKDSKLKEHFTHNQYDAIIVGSDQVWRPQYSPNIYNYFIDFPHNAKNIVAYGASFGTEEWEFSEKETAKCKKLIKQFSAVSVRENTGVNLCADYLEVDATWVLDPTMLLDKEHYIKLFQEKGDNVTQRGIYTYILDRNKEKNKIIESCSQELDLPIYYNQPKVSLANRTSTNIDDYVFPPIEEWLRGFYNADFVITDSFHGVVFSILFNKPFIAIGNKKRGLSRFHSLLSLFRLEDRLIMSCKDINIDHITSDINYDGIIKKLEIYKKMSHDFIKNNI